MNWTRNFARREKQSQFACSKFISRQKSLKAAQAKPSGKEFIENCRNNVLGLTPTTKSSELRPQMQPKATETSFDLLMLEGLTTSKIQSPFSLGKNSTEATVGQGDHHTNSPNSLESEVYCLKKKVLWLEGQLIHLSQGMRELQKRLCPAQL